MEDDTGGELYYSDFLIETDRWECHFCREAFLEDHGDWVEVEGTGEVFGCFSCLEAQDLKHS